ncbi:hypothetical protein A2U01_0095583, partial [Trifolium medium]|nr:hypothetical protein [Trifolium medium]
VRAAGFDEDDAVDVVLPQTLILVQSVVSTPPFHPLWSLNDQGW